MNQEAVNGERHYLEVLQLLHNSLKPELYMEIGVRNAGSLRLARGPAVGIDPLKQFDEELPESTLFYEMTSDDFFEAARRSEIREKVDFAFIDGMHLFEYALRDFINIEQYSTAGTVVVFDDIFPNHPLQAARNRQTQVWTGDVWKLRECLSRYRPELTQIPLNTWPSGLMVVIGLDPANTVLMENYEKIIQEYVETDLGVPETVIKRTGAVSPSNDIINSIYSLSKKIRLAHNPNEEIKKVRQLMKWVGL